MNWFRHSALIRRPLSRSGEEGPPWQSRLFEWLCILLLLASPLIGPLLLGAVMISTFGMLMIALYAGCLLVFLRPLWHRASGALPLPPGTLLWGVFLLYALLRIPGSASPYEARLETVKLFSYLAAYLAWVKLLAMPGRWRVLAGMTLLMGSFICLYAFVQQTRDTIVVWDGENLIGRWMSAVGMAPGWIVEGEYGRRLSGTFICPNHLAALLSILSCMALAIILSPGAGAALRIFAGYGLLTYVPALFLTQSRSGWLGLGSGLTVTLLLVAMRRSLRWFIVLLVLIPVVLAAVGFGAYTYSPMVRDRYHEFVRPQPPEADEEFKIYNIRLDFWKDTVRMIEDEPVWGFGAGTYRYVYPRYISKIFPRYLRYAHNDVLHHTAEYGLVGLALFAAFILAGSWGFLRGIRRTPRLKDAALAAGFMGALVSSLVHCLFDYNLQYYAINHALVLFAAIAASGLFASAHLKVWRPRMPRLVHGAIGLIILVALGYQLQLTRSHYARMDGEKRMGVLDLDGAEAAFDRALRIDPGNHHAMLELAQLFLQRAHWAWEPDDKERFCDAAIEWARRAQARNPYDENGPYVESRILVIREEDEEALAMLREIVERVPNFPYYHKRLARQLHRMGHLEEALEVYRRARSLDRQDTRLPPVIRQLQEEIRAQGSAGAS